MSKKELTVQPGFTIVELMIAVMLAAIVMFGIGVMVVDSQRGWHRMYNRIYSDVATDSYVARKTFDSVIRKATSETFLLDVAGSWIEVYYYEDPNSTVVERYARFSYDGIDQLDIEYGIVEPRGTLSIRPVCENVSSCVFKASGRSAQMILTLDDGSQTATIVSSAVMHNQ
jgi:prepilin-type N-terminal cleavage/methylation domain-containing protein